MGRDLRRSVMWSLAILTVGTIGDFRNSPSPAPSPTGVKAGVLRSQDSAPDSLDFWVGNWDCKGRSRNAPGKDEWSDTVCKNTIRRTLGGKVIEENFSTTGFTGRSWSMFNPNRKIWTQTWVDDSGSYLTFEGGKTADGFMLAQLNTPPGKVRMRMVFSSIKADSFRWDWQRSGDEGKTWETQWELNYTRVK